MSENEFGNLVEFGLSVLQARAYVALLRLGSSRASQISSMLGIVRPEAYRILQELCIKGLVERSLGTPLKFAAVPPDRAVARPSC